MTEPFNLPVAYPRRNAQGSVIDQVCSELKAGRKRTHWMWHIFPQISGLGSGTTARKFAISSLSEAAAYLNHPVLGPRLITCTELVNAIEGRAIEAIFDYPDHLKFHASMPLYARAAPHEAVFQAALKKFFGGQPDKLALERV